MADATRKKVDEDYNALEKYVKDQDSKLMDYSKKKISRSAKVNKRYTRLD